MDVSPARVRAFVMGSAMSQHPDSLRTWYTNLPTEGWLIELARAHGRTSQASWTHEEFAAWLGLRGEELSKAYRLMLKRADNDREELVQLARRLISTESAELPTLQRSVEMSRFRRAREIVERRERAVKSRPCAPCDVDGPIGKQLEAWRIELKFGIDDWSAGLGMVGTTYRSRLSNERNARYRDKLNQLAKDGATLYAKLAAPVIAHHPVVTRDEMVDAYAVVANDIARLREELITPAVDFLPVNDPGARGDGLPFEPLDLYSWLRLPGAGEAEEEFTT